MNSSPRPYLKVTRLHSTQRGTSTTSSCSTLTHSIGPIPSGKSNTSGSLNGSVVYQPRSRSQIERRVEALLDRRPDREGRRELVALDGEVRPVAHADLVDLGEEVVGGVAGEDVREAGLDADPDEREQAGVGPALVLVELLLAEQRVGARERHRHVEVGAAAVEGGLEDRQVEARVGRVQNRVVLAREGGHARLVGRVHLGCRETVVVEPVDERLRPRRVEVGEGDPLEEVAPLRHRGRGRADPTGADDEDLHGVTVESRRGRRAPAARARALRARAPALARAGERGARRRCSPACRCRG